MENVSFSYKKNLILRGVHLSISPEDFIAVIGPNGGGKTTLLKVILGLLKPSSGRVSVMGGDPVKNSSFIGYVPQNVHVNSTFPITALDVVLMGTLGTGNRWGQDKNDKISRAMTVLDRLKMSAHAHKKIGQLSGGQRQLVFIARALMTNPKLLLLDEPTASIDTSGQASFYEMLQDLNKEVAILVVSHDLVVVSKYVKSVACVNQGLHYHGHEEISGDMLETMFSCSVEDVCRVQVLTHGLPKEQTEERHGSS